MAKHGELRLILFRKQNGVCYLCGHAMTMKKDRHNTCTVDHVVPKSRGGREVKGACNYCNNRKGDKSAQEYMALIGRGAFYVCTLVKRETP